jgi:uncharacterized protein
MPKHRKEHVSPTITMYGGAEIDLHNPNVDEVTIEDIAHHLSRMCRWNGTPEHFFSVAEHCVRAAEMAPKEHRLMILLHDCEEAVLGDNITPLKKMIPELVVLGDQIRELLLNKFNVPYYEEETVKLYDRAQLLWELEHIINSTQYKGLSPVDSKILFLMKYKEYCEYINVDSEKNNVLKLV